MLIKICKSLNVLSKFTTGGLGNRHRWWLFTYVQHKTEEAWNCTIFKIPKREVCLSLDITELSTYVYYVFMCLIWKDIIFLVYFLKLVINYLPVLPVRRMGAAYRPFLMYPYSVRAISFLCYIYWFAYIFSIFNFKLVL